MDIRNSFSNIQKSEEFWISVNEFRISVNEFWISVNEFRISVNEFRISEIHLRISEFFNEIHQLMSNDGTLEEVQLGISEANAMLNRLKPDLEQDVIQNLDNIIQAMKDDLNNLKSTVHKGFAAEKSKTGK